MTPPAPIANELALWARRLASMTADDMDALMMEAEDIIAEEESTAKAAMILDGMRAGIEQAREASAGSRVCVVWFDDWGARATFAWDGNWEAGPEVRQAIDSALRANGETGEQNKSET